MFNLMFVAGKNSFTELHNTGNLLCFNCTSVEKTKDSIPNHAKHPCNSSLVTVSP